MDELNRERRLLTVGDVAGRLALGTRSIWRLISAGRLKALRIGKRATRVEVTEVERFITEEAQAR
jgi:excisionase family DNA binding protein